MDVALANASLRFDWAVNGFSYSQLTALLRTERLPISEPQADQTLTHLYKGLGIIVSTQVRSHITSDTDGNGSPDASRTIEYDAQGAVTKSSYDNNNDGVVDSVCALTYNADHSVATYSNARDPVGDGTFHQHAVTTYTYNAFGLLTQQDTTTDDDGSLSSTSETVDSRTTRTYTYDAQGNDVADTYTVDNNADGTPDSQSSDAFAFTTIEDGIFALGYYYYYYYADWSR
jgi:YD repeat-containing protein